MIKLTDREKEEFKKLSDEDRMDLIKWLQKNEKKTVEIIGKVRDDNA